MTRCQLPIAPQPIRVPARSSDKTDAARVRAYLAALPPTSRKVTRELGEIVRAAAPGAVDAFSYNMPAIAIDGKKVVWYAGWKSHSSLYPISATTRTALDSQLEGRANDKGTVRFDQDAPLPAALIRKLVKARLAELKQLEKSRRSR